MKVTNHEEYMRKYRKRPGATLIPASMWHRRTRWPHHAIELFRAVDRMCQKYGVPLLVDIPHRKKSL